MLEELPRLESRTHGFSGGRRVACEREGEARYKAPLASSRAASPISVSISVSTALTHPRHEQRPRAGPAPACLTLWDEEDFQGRRCRLLSDCANIWERGGLRRVRSVKVENGSWVAYEYPDFQGQQFILEKEDYPRWSAWSGSGGHHSDQLLSFRPVLCAMSTNHSDSHVTLFEGDNFQGCKFELSDDYASLPSMGWASKDVGSLKVSSGARVAYQYLGYKGYRYILERDRHGGEFRNYSEFSTQAHSGQLQSIRRVQQQAPWPQHLPRGSSLKAPEPPCPSCLFLGVLFYDLHPHLSEGPSLST
ncbi:PREDICTED: beta-crystallin A2 [Hipposideros armiger]|uniref:Beta-crystallin A2 n=1 Tax=Hipposideros armiger TaxID=186990 RepID=A0A8B7QYH7_HIPAR|nr:PREDICTED: beta-crystallin A2 [Hipposideros armiger]